MKYPLFFASMLFFIFSSFTEKEKVEFFTERNISNDSCRLSKIYINDELSEEYVYDGMGRLYRVNQFKKNEELDGYRLIKYDESGRVLSTELNFVTRKEYKKPGIIKQRYKKVFSYEGDSRLIKEFKSYSGAMWSKGVKDKKLEYNMAGLFIYDSKNRLIKIEFRSTKKKRKRNKLKYWSEINYDHNNNPTRIKDMRLNEKLDTLVNKIVELKYGSGSSLEFDFGEYAYFPHWRNNNLTHFKLIRVKTDIISEIEDYDLETASEEYQFNSFFDENGLPSNCEREIIKNWYYPKGKKHYFEYEYECN